MAEVSSGEEIRGAGFAGGWEKGDGKVKTWCFGSDAEYGSVCTGGVGCMTGCEYSGVYIPSRL